MRRLRASPCGGGGAGAGRSGAVHGLRGACACADARRMRWGRRRRRLGDCKCTGTSLDDRHQHVNLLLQRAHLPSAAQAFVST
eukprot:145174-Chlamydomonas_euryale.AAC.1